MALFVCFPTWVNGSGIKNQSGKNKCPLIAVLQLVRHMPMVVAIATGSYGVFKKDDKAFEEARKSAPSATLEHLSRKGNSQGFPLVRRF